MSVDLQILRRLSDGHFHSGESLGAMLGVSRTAVWKAMQNVQTEYEVEIHSVKGRGYRLAWPVELLDRQRICSDLPADVRAALAKFDILTRVDSTNRYLMAAASQGAASGYLVMAEQQTAGRGRQGRQWISPFGCNLYCSLLWRFEFATSELSGLGLVVAVGLIRALSGFTGQLGIKWPNDIFWRDRKLAGILLEMQGEANGPAAVVIGIGVNVNMPQVVSNRIDQAWVDLCKASGQPVSRNEVAAGLVTNLVSAIWQFERQGLDPFIEAWAEWDVLRDQTVDIIMTGQTLSGIARGIDSRGGLRVEIDGALKTFMAGEVSLRRCK